MKWYSVRFSAVWLLISPFIFAGIVIAFLNFIWMPMQYDFEKVINNSISKVVSAQTKVRIIKQELQKERLRNLRALTLVEGKICYLQERDIELNKIARRWQERAIALETRQEVLFCALEDAKLIREIFEKVDSNVELDEN